MPYFVRVEFGNNLAHNGLRRLPECPVRVRKLPNLVEIVLERIVARSTSDVQTDDLTDRSCSSL